MFYIIIIVFEEGGFYMQEMVKYSDKDVIVMKLLHYFITEEGYNPVILHGAKDEIWLENQKKDYKIVRIVSNYIHNDEQYKYDIYKTKDIVRNIKKKTLNFTIDTLSIFVNLGEDVNLLNIEHIDCIDLKTEDDLNKYAFLYEHFPNMKDKLEFSEKGIDLFMKITSDINRVNVENSKKAEEIFKPKKPIVTYIILGINILMFLITLFPYMSDILINLLSTYGPLIRVGQYYRLLSGAFLHVDIFHIFFNMYALYMIGTQIESFYGYKKYLFIYLFSAVAASLLSITISDVPSIGASGAIFGLLGAMLYFGYHYRVYLGATIKKTILPVIVINLALGFMMSGVDNAAHIGGLIGGVIASVVMGVKHSDDKQARVHGIVIGILYMAFLIYFGIMQ